ncbi:putative translation initiation factor eIF-2B subunit gamma [Psilocybe cubensis]|uniref:Translation initiation factor eIF-2B subunit gamma n=2 Tax=Psilocybe cubensis TaxID=181762 RepID=A0ACB8HCA5_PSICU|nr:putative translation initiation factor eIF-2B subunit gamma [Psilocybe cubensis]KAH9485327.1 putative translation initiation factor eIF-2B subunit gamma [Psilocybe cubensis]
MDLDNVKSDLVTREFLAVVLAGFGNDLVPLTSDYGDEPCPKSLLPIANKPLLEYTLLWLEQSGIKDVLLICPTTHRSSIYHHIHSDVSSSSLRIDLQTYDESQDSNTGTCALLRHFSNRISEDFVVVPCDFIPPPSLPLSLLLNKFRIDALSEACMATTCWYTSRAPEKGTVPEEWGPVSSPSPLVWDPSTGTLLYVDTPDDQDRNGDEVDLKMSLLSRFPRVKLSASLKDSHVYVCRRYVLDLLHEKPHFLSLKEEFFPWLCKLQYRRSKRVKYGKTLRNMVEPKSQAISLQHSSFVDKSSQAHQIDSPIEPDDELVQTKIGVIVHDKESEPAMRINTLQTFFEANKRVLSGTTYSLPVDPKNRSLIDQRAQISNDSIVGESTQISERTTIKRSVIGRHCIIGKMVKVTGCVLLDHCIIEDGAKLDNCILGKNTQEEHSVKGEKLEVSDWMATPDTTVAEHDSDDNE